jgi:hypothetical protein
MEQLWKPNDAEFAVTYPLKEMMRRAQLKIKIHDRNIPMTSDTWGMFPDLVHRYTRLLSWRDQGVKEVIVFYNPEYYVRNRQTVELMDPLHMRWVLKYNGVKG